MNALNQTLMLSVIHRELTREPSIDDRPLPYPPPQKTQPELPSVPRIRYSQPTPLLQLRIVHRNPIYGATHLCPIAMHLTEALPRDTDTLGSCSRTPKIFRTSSTSPGEAPRTRGYAATWARESSDDRSGHITLTAF